MSGPYFTDEEWSGLLARCVTNQQATANHTAKMANEVKLKSAIANLPQYDPTPYMQWKHKMRYHSTEIKSRDEMFKEHKMTRNEAKKKWALAFRCNETASEDYISALEALGLIKFDEEKPSVEEIIYGWCPTPKKLIESLDHYGYKIVKK